MSTQHLLSLPFSPAVLSWWPHMGYALLLLVDHVITMFDDFMMQGIKVEQ